MHLYINVHPRRQVWSTYVAFPSEFTNYTNLARGANLNRFYIPGIAA